jgi:hypothetical protein
MGFLWHLLHSRTRLTGYRLGTLVALALVLMVFAGCMRVQRSFTLNSDGSGVYVLTIGIRYPIPGDPASIPTNSVTAMEAFGAHVQRQGGTYRRYDEQGYTYWSYTRPFTSTSQANTLLQEDPRQDDQTHFLVLYHDTLHITTHSEFLRPPTYQVTGIISLADATGAAEQNWRDATETLTITMPNGVRAHHGGLQEGNSVTYTIAYNQTATVDVTGNVSQTNTANIAVLALGMALLALTLAAIGVRLLWQVAHPTVRRKG